MGFLDFLKFGNNDIKKIDKYLQKGAIVLDVRNPDEWAQGKARGSKLITLNDVQKNISKIKSWDKPIIVVCRSGVRAGNILPFLTRNDIDAINGGAWQNVIKN